MRKSRPGARVPVPFRDDTSLVAFRYEQTVQAEPPTFIIPIPPRNPARHGRPYSGLSSSPVVVVPREQHPALRPRCFDAIDEEWKRDSGLAPTSSSVTVHDDLEDPFIYDKLVLADAPPSTYTADESLFSASDCPSRCETPDLPPEAARAPSPSDEARPASPSSFAKEAGRILARSLSFRSESSSRRRLRKKSSADRVPPSGPPSPQPKMAEPENGAARATSDADQDFTPIDTTIPTESLIDDDDLTSLTFSKRGSLMFGGKRAFPLVPSAAERAPDATAAAEDATDATATARDAPEPPSQTLSVPSIRVTALDVERESEKVRSFYESGDAYDYEDGGRPASRRDGLGPAGEAPSGEEGETVVYAFPWPSCTHPRRRRPALTRPARPPSLASLGGDDRLFPDPSSLRPRSAGSSSLRPHSRARSASELAGGLEDWEDVDGADVDRYGFIRVRRPQTRPTTPDTAASTQDTPARRTVLVKRRDSVASPSGPGRTPGRKVSARSLNTQASELSTTSRRSTLSAIRAAANMLPHNRDRKLMDEAGEMLTLAPGLADIAEDEQADKISDALKKKEWERSEKWRKMAKVVKKGRDGEGMEFDFDTTSSKVIDRTWKGIPDRWRAAAWYSFLAASARRAESKETDEGLVAEFHWLQAVSSADDVQIDLDVPRTINRHIMFRRRYRGGQRLLFRVLHALSLYFPATGYVQGMASLAATLLCYYDEERCFVMLVRMWRLRGLEQLYSPGFACLVATLRTLEDKWLDGKDVAAKLLDLGIDATAYGTRWYLTLFNLSVPFPAQLRIWDVFMLLGDSPPAPAPVTPPAEPSASASAGTAPQPAQPDAGPDDAPPPPLPGLDVLHAASAALMHALRDVLLDSDFENAMKAVTSWVPIKDEELLMKVTRAEWKLHHHPPAGGGRRHA